MNITAPKFNVQDQPDFFRELRTRVDSYFTDNKISRYANSSMKFKTVFMLCLYFTPFVLMLTGVVASTWTIMAMWVLMSFGMSGIGLSIMHDANHGAYSNKQWVNNALGFLLNFIGGYHINWKIQHNYLHHTYTNVEGMDEDINNKFLCFSPNQERRSMHKYQAYYAPFLYGLMTFYWFVSKDFEQVYRYKRKDLLKSHNLTAGKAITEVIFHKVWYLGLMLILPIIFVAMPWWQTVIGFVVMQFLCGVTLALIFQPAHVIKETDFYVPQEKGNLENNWAIHQLHTTANFANESTFFSWFVGGLNFQVEHHLFPKVCHIHYKQISKIVRETAQEYNVPYHEHKTFLGALKSHFGALDQFGRGTYTKYLNKA